jgi:uncharacterized protein (DUF488 family)
MLTIGHSTLPIEMFLQALRQSKCGTLVDVRSIPRSRRNPQYEQPALFAALEHAGIRPIWRKGLGGLRHALPRERSVNNGWRNDSFRGYADYMQTEEFAAEMEWLMGLPNFGGVAVMCAEAVPWRCHRSLIADAVLARGGAVEDILVTQGGKVERRTHAMTSFARVQGTRVWYPPETGELFDPS